MKKKKRKNKGLWWCKYAHLEIDLNTTRGSTIDVAIPLNAGAGFAPAKEKLRRLMAEEWTAISKRNY